MLKKLLFWAAIAGILYGAFLLIQRLKAGQYIKETFASKPGIVQRTGDFDVFDLSKSTQPPFCQGEACKNVIRYFIHIEGDKGRLNIITDFNDKDRSFSHTVLCDPNNNQPLAVDQSITADPAGLCQK